MQYKWKQIKLSHQNKSQQQAVRKRQINNGMYNMMFLKNIYMRKVKFRLQFLRLELFWLGPEGLLRARETTHSIRCNFWHSRDSRRPSKIQESFLTSVRPPRYNLRTALIMFRRLPAWPANFIIHRFWHLWGFPAYVKAQQYLDH